MWGAHTEGEEELYIAMLRLRGNGVDQAEIFRRMLNEVVEGARVRGLGEEEIEKSLKVIADGRRKEVR